MISIDEARKIIYKSIPKIESVTLPLEYAAGLVLSADIKSDIDVPPFNKATMDGYAIHASDSGVGSELKIDAVIAAGEFTDKKIKKGHAVKIMTGAPVPDGVDSVIQVELTSQIDNNTVKLNSKIEKGKNIAIKGEEINKGGIVLNKGTEISAPVAAVLAQVGCFKVPVYPRPSVLILSTGSELIEIDKKPHSGQIRESNSYGLLSQCSGWGAAASRRPLVRDTETALQGAIGDAIELNPDIIILSGGVSEGEYDLVPKVLTELGVKILFHKVAQKPGKPMLFGTKDDILIFGMAGNPVASFIGFELYAGPSIRRMMGEVDYDVTVHEAFASGDFKIKSDRMFLPQGIATNVDGRWEIEPVKSKGSADIFSVVKTNAYAIFDKGEYIIYKGQKVKFVFYRGAGYAS